VVAFALICGHGTALAGLLPARFENKNPVEGMPQTLQGV
jgi:hypothetical protein